MPPAGRQVRWPPEGHQPLHSTTGMLPTSWIWGQLCTHHHLKTHTCEPRETLEKLNWKP